MASLTAGLALLSLAYQPPTATPRTSPRRHSTPRLVASPVAVTSAAHFTDLTEDARRLTDAQIARTIAVVSHDGVLCTQLQSPDGATFASPAPFVVDDQGCPLAMQPSAQAATRGWVMDASSPCDCTRVGGGGAGGNTSGSAPSTTA